MEQVKILIVEDELIIAESLKTILEQMGYAVPAIFTSGLETLNRFRPGFADVIFMDIQLANHTNGVDTAIELMKISPCPIIFITNIADERVRRKAIYETHAVHYIIKPFSRQDIAVALDLALKSIRIKQIYEELKAVPPGLSSDCVFLKYQAGYKKIMLGEILYLQAEGSYCRVHLKNENLLYSENLSFFAEKFAFSKEFLRVHRSFIINTAHIEKVQENRLWITGREIPIGKTYVNSLKNIFRFI